MPRYPKTEEERALVAELEALPVSRFSSGEGDRYIDGVRVMRLPGGWRVWRDGKLGPLQRVPLNVARTIVRLRASG